MKKFTKIEPVEQGDCSCSPSLSLAGDQSLLREITKCSPIIDWEQHYEKLIYKRSNRRLKRGLGKLQALCNDLLTRSDSTLLNPVTDNGDSDELDEEDLEQHEDGPTQFENLTDTRDSDELDEEYVDQHEDGPTQFENLMDTGDSDELDEEDAEQHQNPLVQSDNLLAGLVQEGTDPELDEVSLEDHEVSAETSRDFIKIRILCRCGAEQQLIVMGNECFLMISPNEDVSGEHHKLVWASKEENELLIGIDCSCGTSLLYSLQ